MENKVLERLRVFIKNKSLTIKAFGESLDMSEGTLKNMFSRGTSPSAETLIKVSNVYQELSLDWLLTGMGEMLKDKAKSPKGDNSQISSKGEHMTVISPDNKDHLFLLDMLEKKDKRIEELKEEIGILKARLNADEEKNRDYTDEASYRSVAENEVDYEKKK